MLGKPVNFGLEVRESLFLVEDFERRQCRRRAERIAASMAGNA